MSKILFRFADGSSREIGAQPGVNLMEAALQADVPGIDGECGGAGICGTCHVHVPPEWYDRLPKPERMESELLEGLDNACPHSRLACQLIMRDALDGMPLTIPQAAS